MVKQKLDAKTIYAQSSDIKSRTYLEYRKDMKRKAIAELEILDWLQHKIKEYIIEKIGYPFEKNIIICKSGGDKFLWFLRKGGITREPDFIAEMENKKIEIEFQYAEKSGLNFYDFKVSKVAKKKDGQRIPIENKIFVYVHKPLIKYAIFEPKWIVENGNYGIVEAWRSYAYRIPKDKFEKILKDDDQLKDICTSIDVKNFLLNFQHDLIEIIREKFSGLLQGIIDDKKIVKLIPYNLDSFFKICFVLDHIQKVPRNANLWLIYLLSYVNESLDLEKIFQITYCIDFLYSKIELKENELNQLVPKIEELLRMIDKFAQENGSYTSSAKISPIEETRYALFSINLIEDITQDIIFYYQVRNLEPITKIFMNIKNLQKTFSFLKEAQKSN
ncbi:MAG: hypothetical protein QXG86_04065 [Candidatus Woesearchaeota archaeon]